MFSGVHRNAQWVSLVPAANPYHFACLVILLLAWRCLSWWAFELACSISSRAWDLKRAKARTLSLPNILYCICAHRDEAVCGSPCSNTGEREFKECACCNGDWKECIPIAVLMAFTAFEEGRPRCFPEASWFHSDVCYILLHSLYSCSWCDWWYSTVILTYCTVAK